MRERIEALLSDAMHGEHCDSSVLMGEAALARLHMVVRPKIGDQAHYDVAELEKGVAAIVRNWHDDLRDALVQHARRTRWRGAGQSLRQGPCPPATSKT